LNLVSTILSKRSLKWFVESNHAENWYDPRFPTVQGIMRRGLTVDALKLFMLEQGPSKNTNLMEWDKLWALNKQYIDPIAPRYTAIVKSSSAKVILENMPEQIEAKSVSLHPKNDAVGSKAVIFGKYCWIERDDAEGINEGEKIALRNYGKVLITKKAEVDGFLTLYGTYDQEDKDFKKAKIVTWICADEGTTVEIELIEFGHLITKKKVEETDDVKQLVNLNSRVQYTALAEGSMRHLQHGQIIQLERRGFFFVDQISHGDKKLVLNYIPDGKQNPMSKLPQAIDPSTL
jgi:glutamyl-tRNA synthetase